MVSITINHVMSNEVQSKIFDDILGYFSRYSTRFLHHVSERPALGAMIRHYHRPNLESDLLTPAIVTVHHDLAETDEWLHFSKYERQYRQADMIICLNRTQQESLAKVGITKTVVIPHGYNERFLRPIDREFDGKRKIRLGVFSRRYPRKVKGEAYMEELAKHLDPDHFSFLHIGQGRSADAKYVRGIGFEAKAYETLPYPVLCSAYQQIDLLLMASRYEGGPANVPEAVATGTPLATSRVGMAIDLLQEGVNGLFLTLNPAIDAAALEGLYENPQRLRDLFNGACRVQGSVHTWQAVVAQHEKIYTDMISALLE
jgi:glycosyltransferase involved in cell wall biosynthesis